MSSQFSLYLHGIHFFVPYHHHILSNIKYVSTPLIKLTQHVSCHFAASKGTCTCKEKFPCPRRNRNQNPSSPQPYRFQLKNSSFPSVSVVSNLSAQDNDHRSDVLLSRWLSSHPRHPVSLPFHRSECMLRLHGCMSRQPPLPCAGWNGGHQQRHLYRSNVGRSSVSTVLLRR